MKLAEVLKLVLYESQFHLIKSTAVPNFDSTCSLEGIAIKQLVSIIILAKILNILILASSLPEFMACFETLFQKISNAIDQFYFRPISLISVLCRLFHKIVATRLTIPAIWSSFTLLSIN